MKQNKNQQIPYNSFIGYYTCKLYKVYRFTTRVPFIQYEAALFHSWYAHLYRGVAYKTKRVYIIHA